MSAIDEVDDVLRGFGIELNSPSAIRTINLQTPIVVQDSAETPEPEHSETTPLSDEDFSEVLDELGFDDQGDTEDDDEWSEEDIDEAEREAIENDESTDSDSSGEENLTWTSGPHGTTTVQGTIHVVANDDSVHFHYPDGHTVSVPIIQAEPEESVAETAINNEQPQAEETEEEEEPVQQIIRPNSPTFLIDDSTSRFSGTEWYSEIQKQKIILAGLGGIGSNCAFQLARMVPDTLVLYDNDDVESANMSGQLYSASQVGRKKVYAISNMLSDYTAITNVYATPELFTLDEQPGPIMICGFDNMRARNDFFTSWSSYLTTISDEARKECLYIDGRLSLDTLQVLCIRGDDDYNIQRYKDNFLFSDEEAEETVCSMKQTTYLACMIGSIMVNLFTNHVANLLNPIIPYDLPFFTEYDSKNMIFKTEN